MEIETEIVPEIPKTIEEMVSTVHYYCTNSAFTSRFILECNCCDQTGSDGQYIMIGRKHPMGRVYYHSKNYQCVRAIYIAQLKIFWKIILLVIHMIQILKKFQLKYLEVQEKLLMVL